MKEKIIPSSSKVDILTQFEYKNVFDSLYLKYIQVCILPSTPQYFWIEVILVSGFAFLVPKNF